MAYQAQNQMLIYVIIQNTELRATVHKLEVENAVQRDFPGTNVYVSDQVKLQKHQLIIKGDPESKMESVMLRAKQICIDTGVVLIGWGKSKKM